MRIALVITSLGAGGAERVMVTLANHWAMQGHAVTVLTFAPPGTRPYYALDPRVTLRDLDVATSERLWHSVLQSVRRVFVLRRALRATRPDLVVAFLIKINIVTILATRGLGVRLVVTEHNNPERQPVNPVWDWLRRRLYGVADRLVTPSRGVLTALRTEVRGQVIPNPVEVPPSPPPRSDSRTLVAVGRLVEQKGFDLLLAAFARIAGKHPDWSLVIWGEGDQRPRLEAMREQLDLDGRVDLPGVTKRPGQWIEDAGLFVLSSRFEGFGIVVTEAMAAGLPVVVADCPWGPGEIVQHGVDGWLVPPEDVAALAEGLDLLMGDAGLRARLAEAARHNVRRFEREAVMKMWDDLADGLHDDDAAPAAAGGLRVGSEAP